MIPFSILNLCPVTQDIDAASKYLKEIIHLHKHDENISNLPLHYTNSPNPLSRNNNKSNKRNPIVIYKQKRDPMKNLLLTTTILIAFGFSSAAFAANAPAKDPENNTYIEQAITKLPAKDAAQFRDTMKQAHEKNMAIYDQVHSLHDDMEAILVAEPFNKDAFRSKSKELQDVYDTMRSNMDDAFVSAVAQLPQSERKTIAAAMAYPHKKHVSTDANKAQ